MIPTRLKRYENKPLSERALRTLQRHMELRWI